MAGAKIDGRADRQGGGRSRRAGAFTVREGEARDIPDVVALDTRITGLAKPEFWQAFADKKSARRGEPRHFLVAEPEGGGRLLGFIIGEVRAWEFGSPPTGWVFAISVDPAARQSGVASALMAAIEGRFRADGVRHMRTMLSRDNHLLMSFFRAQGMMAGPYIELEKDLSE